MTPAQILSCSIAELEAMTDEELLKHFAPYLPECRRTVAAADIRRAVSLLELTEKKTQKQQLNDLAAQAEAMLKGLKV